MAEEFNRLLHDPEVRCLMASIGGMNSNALLPYIDYEALRKDPMFTMPIGCEVTLDSSKQLVTVEENWIS